MTIMSQFTLTKPLRSVKVGLALPPKTFIGYFLTGMVAPRLSGGRMKMGNVLHSHLVASGTSLLEFSQSLGGRKQPEPPSNC